MERYIDIHSHILYGVDDGAATREVSVRMLKEAAKQGITDIVATPHYRKGMFSYPAAKIFSHYRDLCAEAHKVGIRLSLGCEYFVDGDIYENLRRGRVPTIGGTRYVLTEFGNYSAYSMIRLFSQGLLRQGYLPIIAHAERIEKLVAHMNYVRELSDLGVMFQLNANNVLGEGGLVKQRFCARMLREGLADFVASDAHNMDVRPIRLAQCAEYVEKHMGAECRQRVFGGCACRILKAGA